MVRKESSLCYKVSADHLNRYGIHGTIPKDCDVVDESFADRDGTYLPTTCKGQASCTVAPSNVCRCTSVYSKRAFVSSLYVKSPAKDMGLNVNIAMDHTSKGDTELDQHHSSAEKWHKHGKPLDMGTPVNERGYVSTDSIVLLTGTRGEYNHFFDHVHLIIEEVCITDIADIENNTPKNLDGKHGIEECHLNQRYIVVEKRKKEYNFKVLKKQLHNALFNNRAFLRFIVLLQQIMIFHLLANKLNNRNDPLPESGNRNDTLPESGNRSNDPLPESGNEEVPGSYYATQDQETAAETNQESECRVCKSPLSPGPSSSMPTVSNTVARLPDSNETCEVLGTKVNDYDNAFADNDSESEPERDTYPIQHKRKADYLPPHLKERYVPFMWDYDDDNDESPYAPDPHWSARSRNKSTISSQKASRISAAQNESQKRRDNATDTSSEDSHTSVNIKLKDSYLA